MPSVVLFGNCQIAAVGQFLMQHPDFQGWEICYLDANNGARPLYQTPERCRLFISQDGFDHDYLLATLPADIPVFVLPRMMCSVLWPLTFHRGEVPSGWLFPYGDRYILSKQRQNIPAKAIIDAYMAEKLDEMFDFERMMALQIEEWASYDHRTDFAISDYIIENALSTRLFFTPDHPSDHIILRLLNQILTRIGKSLFTEPNWDTHAHTRGTTEVPIHPSVLRRFSLPSPAPDHAYRLYGTKEAVQTYEYYYLYASTLYRPSIKEAMEDALGYYMTGNINRAYRLSTWVHHCNPNTMTSSLLALMQAAVGEHHQAAILMLTTLFDQA